MKLNQHLSDITVYCCCIGLNYNVNLQVYGILPATASSPVPRDLDTPLHQSMPWLDHMLSPNLPMHNMLFADICIWYVHSKHASVPPSGMSGCGDAVDVKQSAVYDSNTLQVHISVCLCEYVNYLVSGVFLCLYTTMYPNIMDEDWTAGVYFIIISSFELWFP